MKFSDIDLRRVGINILLHGAVFADEDQAFYLPFPNSGSALPPLTTIDMTLDDWKVFLRQADLMETEVLSKTSDGELYKAIVRKSSRAVENQVQWNVFRRDGYACRYCGNNKIPLTVDHLVRWEDGGPSIEANLVAACRKCNKVRGDIAYASWLGNRFYLEASKKLTPEIRARNEAVANTLADIPRVIIIRDRK